MLGEVLVGVVADRVALHRVGLQVRNRVIDALHPARISGREDGVREHAPGAGKPVHVGPRLRLHLVGEEPVLRHFRGSAADAGHLGIAVEIDLLEVVREHQIVDRLLLLPQRRIPSRLAHRVALVDEGLDPRSRPEEVRVHVHDELLGELLRPRIGVLGGGRLRLGHAEEAPVGAVHGEERRRHSRGRLEEATPAHAEMGRGLGAHRLHSRFELALLGRLRTRHELIARDALHRDRRRKQRLRRDELRKLFLGKETHGRPLSTD